MLANLTVDRSQSDELLQVSLDPSRASQRPAGRFLQMHGPSQPRDDTPAARPGSAGINPGSRVSCHISGLDWHTGLGGASSRKRAARRERCMQRHELRPRGVPSGSHLQRFLHDRTSCRLRLLHHLADCMQPREVACSWKAGEPRVPSARLISGTVF